jgi:hypothetical protein
VNADPILIRYRFQLEDGSIEPFDLLLDPQSLTLTDQPPAKPPEWTRLGFHQCPHCPLDGAVYPNCPLSVNLVRLVDSFGRLISHDNVRVVVVMRQRRVSQTTTAQAGISSLMGLLIAVSECPYTDFLKPMARFHLPFADETETVWRAVSTYLLAQYFLCLEGVRKKINPDGIVKIYNDIERMNVAVAKRLRAASKQDSTVNALVRLDVFAKHFNPGFGSSLKRLQAVFQPFLRRLA